uniref:Uncharacterized protein n=1 Tax=Rhizobium rhizogenes TaxID=359 RepID=A0A7S5DRZ2_RHIRH|nr:hypothetical protein pC5.8b_361 [Rhizobium rhizogenes]
MALRTQFDTKIDRVKFLNRREPELSHLGKAGAKSTLTNGYHINPALYLEIIGQNPA